MKIKKLKIKNFKKFDDATFEFSEGVNVVQGLNEAGKSTLSHAILVLLFGDPATKSKQFLDTYSSWDQNGSIFLQAEGTSPTGEFSLTKDFGLRLSKLMNLTTKKETMDPSTVQKAITNLLGGIASQKVFESTAFIKQAEIARIEKGSDFISAVQKAASASGMEGGVQEVIKKIDKELNELKKGLDRPTNTPGKIKSLQVQIQDLKTNLTDMNSKWEKVKEAAHQEKSSKGESGEIKERISLIEVQLENNKKFKDANERIKSIDQQIVRFERQLSEVAELNVQINLTQKSIEEYGNAKGLNLDSLAEKVSELKALITAKKQNLEKMKDEKPDVSEEEEKGSSKFILIAAGIGVIVVGLILFVVLKMVLILIGLGLVGAAILGYGVATLLSSSSKQKSEVNSQQKAQEELATEIKSEETKMSELLTKYNFKDVDDFYMTKTKIAAFSSEKANLEATLKGMLGGKSMDEIKQEQAELLAQKKTIEVNELTEDVKNSSLSSEEYLRKRRELDTLKMEERRLMQLETASKVRVEDAGVSIDDIVEVEEQLEMLEEDLNYYNRRMTMLELVKSSVSEAVQSTAQDAGKVVREFVKVYLPKITKDRYTDIKVENDLSIQVFSKDKGDWINPTNTLSAGTIDQIYFLTRLAFLKLVAKDANPPIILDDPFVTFDAQRRESTKEILHEIAKDHQVILLTHHAEYKDWGNVVEINN